MKAALGKPFPKAICQEICAPCSPVAALTRSWSIPSVSWGRIPFTGPSGEAAQAVQGSELMTDSACSVITRERKNVVLLVFSMAFLAEPLINSRCIDSEKHHVHLQLRRNPTILYQISLL